MQLQTNRKLIALFILLVTLASCGNRTTIETIETSEVAVLVEDFVAFETLPPGTHEISQKYKVYRVSCEPISMSATDFKTNSEDQPALNNIRVEVEIVRDCGARFDFVSSWGLYKDILLDDTFAKQRTENFIRQAVRVCGTEFPEITEDPSDKVLQLFGECIENDMRGFLPVFFLKLLNVQVFQ